MRTFALLLLAAVLAGAQTAEEWLQRAAAAPAGPEQIALLEQAVAADDGSARAHFQLAKACAESREWQRAEDHYRKAAGRSTTPQQNALSLRGWAEALRAQGNLVAAIDKAKESLTAHRYAATETLLVQWMGGRNREPVTASEIRSVLKGLASRSAVAGPPEIDLLIHFDFNSDTLTPEGERQVKELSSALLSYDLAAGTFRVIGHTDRHGEEGYNRSLSFRRAERVAAALVAVGIPRAKLRPEGRGKREPLVLEESDAADAVNRRVAVQAIP